jgi:hypothetical protein
MAYTAPGTAVAGDVLTAAFWNTNVRDNISDHESRINDVGLVIVTPSSVAGSGVTLSNSQVSFSSATSVSVNGVFTSSYENYCVKITSLGSANGGTNEFRFRASGSDTAGTSYNYAAIRLGSNLTAYNAAANATSGIPCIYTDTTGRSASSFDVFRPVTADTRKVVIGSNSQFQTGITSLLAVSFGGEVISSTSFDGFSIVAGTGNISGTLRVYGYQNS